MKTKPSNVANSLVSITRSNRRESIKWNGGTYRQTKDGTGYDCQYCNGGKQLRKRVKTIPEARAWIDDVSSNQTPIKLTRKQLVDAMDAYRLIRDTGDGRTLLELVQRALGTTGTSGTANDSSNKLSKAMENYIEDCRKRLKPITWENYQRHLRKMIAHVGDIPVDAVTRKDIMEYSATIATPQLHAHFLRAAKAFFNWAMGNELATSNPCRNIKFYKLEEPKREYLTIDQSIRLLEGTIELYPNLVPYIVLGLFAGLRPTETIRLNAGDINLATGVIRLGKDQVKTGAGRVIKMTPNLIEWLTAFPVDSGKVVPVSGTPLAKRLRRIDKIYGVGLSKDVLRHTAATYKVAMTQDSAATALEMGHREDVAIRYYRGVVTQSEGQKFFEISPPAEGSKTVRTASAAGGLFTIPIPVLRR